MTVDEFIAQWHDGSDTVEVHTSGSTGTPKVMLVDKRRMLASARMTCDFLGLKSGDTALLCMSVDFIAGKMMVVRAMERGLRLMTVKPSSHPLAMPDFTDEMGKKLDFAAMVPMQVYSSLQVPREREILGNIRHIIIGGGPLDTSLESELRGFENAIWHSYGMTETLSHSAMSLRWSRAHSASRYWDALTMSSSQAALRSTLSKWSKHWLRTSPAPSSSPNVLIPSSAMWWSCSCKAMRTILRPPRLPARQFSPSSPVPSATLPCQNYP